MAWPTAKPQPTAKPKPAAHSQSDAKSKLSAKSYPIATLKSDKTSPYKSEVFHNFCLAKFFH